jgi:pimeloyl-ACP methyl ester carboxylesterase
VIRRLTSCQLVEIPGGGHDLGVEQPEAVAHAMNEFFDLSSDLTQGRAAG